MHRVCAGGISLGVLPAVGAVCAKTDFPRLKKPLEIFGGICYNKVTPLKGCYFENYKSAERICFAIKIHRKGLFYYAP